MVKVLYVAGAGHSGSTILNLLLGASEKTFSLGETKPLSKFIHGEGRDPESDQIRCTCGETHESCEFWSVIQDDQKLLSDNVSHYTRLKLFSNVLLAAQRDVVNRNGDLYKGLLDRAKQIKGEQVEWLIDSSKDVELLWHLQNHRDIDLHVVHLVRDSVANVNSFQKMGYSLFSGILLWYWRNVFIKLFQRRFLSKQQYQKLTYTALAKHPEDTINKLNEKWDLQLPSDYIERVRNERYHNFAGNNVRFEEFNGMYFDDSWKDELPRWKQHVVTFFTWLPNKIWTAKKY